MNMESDSMANIKIKKRYIVIAILFALIGIGTVGLVLREVREPESFYWDDPADTNPDYYNNTAKI